MGYKLPSAESLGNPQQIRTQSVVPIQLGREEQAQMSAAESGMQDANVISGIGKQLFDAGQRLQDRQDRSNYIKEKSLFLQAMVAAESEIGSNGDTDYVTFGPRLNDRLQKAKQDAASKIQNPAMREQFLADTDLDIRQGLSRMAAKSWAMEADNGRADVNAVSARNREMAMRTRDPKVRESLLHNTQQAIQSALNSGYIDPTQAEELNRKTATDYAMAYINTQHPAEQIRLLAEVGGPADLIPSDVRKSMEEKAMSDLATEQSRIDQMLKRQKEAVMNAASLSVEQNGNLSAISPDVWAMMDMDQRKKLSEYAKYVAEGQNVPTDPVAFNDLWTMASHPQTQGAFLNIDMNDYLLKLSKEDRQALIKEQARIREKGVSELAQGYQTTQQAIQNSLLGAGYDPSPKPGTREAESVARLNYLVNQKIAQERVRLNKKELSAEEEKKVIDQFFIPKTTENLSWIRYTPIGFVANRAFGMFEPEQKRTFEMTVDDISTDDRKTLEEALKELGRPVTDDNILDLYQTYKQ